MTASSEQDQHTAERLKSLELDTRDENSGAGRFIYWAGALFALFHIYVNTIGTMSELWVSAIHFSGFALLCALMVPMRQAHTHQGQKMTLAIDMLIGLIAVGTTLYLMLFEDALYARGVHFVTADWVVAIVAIAIALEMTRRTTGWFIPGMILFALTYVFWWGKYVPGMFHFPGLSLETVLFRSYFSSEGMFGSIAQISWTYVFMFILFGAFLVKSGAGDFIIELSRCVAGRFVGGPGLVAVFGSGLMGSVSGSSVANTVSTGVITIPMMQKAGFPAKFAAGVEAAASTGGQLMPPVMGAGAFIMASYTQIPYVSIIGIAALPALLYFLSVGFYVRVEAKRHHTEAVEFESRPLKDVMKEGWHCLLPLIVLVALLIYGFTPTYAAGISIIAVVAASWLSPKRMGPKEILDALAQGSKNMATTAMLLIAVGLVVNVVAMTGIGNTFSLMVTDWAGGSLFVTLALVALASLVLGMGLPVTAAYIVLATLSAPAIYNLMAEQELINLIAAGNLPETARTIFMLIDPNALTALASPMPHDQAAALVAQVPGDFKSQLLQQALDPVKLSMILLAAHMIIFWLSQDSNVTPPVCLTAFAAAAIARTPAMATGFTAWKLSKGLYVVPLLFAYTPLIGGSFEEVLQIFIFATIGLYAFVGFMEGYLEGRLNIALRLLSGACALGLLWPHGHLLWDIAAAVVFVGLFIFSRRFDKKPVAAAA